MAGKPLITSFNRGMSLEAIAAMLGHRSLDMTLRYAKIASRTVADEYFAVTEKVEALYGQDPVLPAWLCQSDLAPPTAALSSGRRNTRQIRELRWDAGDRGRCRKSRSGSSTRG